MEKFWKTYPTIGVDASRAFIEQPSGTENYSYQIIQAITKQECQLGIRLYLRPKQKTPEGFIRTTKKIQTKTIPWYRLWTQAGLVLETWLDKPDLLFIPAHVIPFLKPPFLPTVVTVHDLRTEFLPKHQDLRQKIYLNRWIEWLRSRLATHIIAVSQATKNDLIELLEVPAEKISVVYEGVDLGRFTPKLKTQNEKLKMVLDKYKIRGRYILFVGTIQPRKNLQRLIKAFALIREGIPEVHLVLAGNKGWLAEEIYATPKMVGLEDLVDFIGYAAHEDLPYLYAGAEVLAYPSLYEGFGLPILEALAVGIPVVTSSISSMPEVGGDLAIYVDPYDQGSIAQGLRKALSSYPLDLKQALKHVSQFSWAKAGEETIEVFKKILGI